MEVAKGGTQSKNVLTATHIVCANKQLALFKVISPFRNNKIVNFIFSPECCAKEGGSESTGSPLWTLVVQEAPKFYLRTRLKIAPYLL